MAPRFVEIVSPVEDGRKAILPVLDWLTLSSQRILERIPSVDVKLDWVCNSSSPVPYICDESFAVNLTAFDSPLLTQIASTPLPTGVAIRLMTLGIAFLVARVIFVRRYGAHIVKIHGHSH